jgi:hypothetical protein
MENSIIMEKFKFISKFTQNDRENVIIGSVFISFKQAVAIKFYIANEHTIILRYNLVVLNVLLMFIRRCGNAEVGESVRLYWGKGICRRGSGAGVTAKRRYATLGSRT